MDCYAQYQRHIACVYWSMGSRICDSFSNHAV